LANSLEGSDGNWVATQKGASLPVTLDLAAGENVQSEKLVEYNIKTMTYNQYYWYPYVDHDEGPTTLVWKRQMDMQPGDSTVFHAVLGPVVRN
jgi:hypothetical protein